MLIRRVRTCALRAIGKCARATTPLLRIAHWPGADLTHVCGRAARFARRHRLCVQWCVRACVHACMRVQAAIAPPATHSSTRKAAAPANIRSFSHHHRASKEARKQLLLLHRNLEKARQEIRAQCRSELVYPGGARGKRILHPPPPPPRKSTTSFPHPAMLEHV